MSKKKLIIGIFIIIIILCGKIYAPKIVGYLVNNGYTNKESIIDQQSVNNNLVEEKIDNEIENFLKE